MDHDLPAIECNGYTRTIYLLTGTTGALRIGSTVDRLVCLGDVCRCSRSKNLFADQY